MSAATNEVRPPTAKKVNMSVPHRKPVVFARQLFIRFMPRTLQDS